MRVNHTGEICAQGLYNGQAVFASNPETAEALTQAAAEELDHLAWCRERLDELGGKPSLLDPLWYTASFALGAGAALIQTKSRSVLSTQLKTTLNVTSRSISSDFRRVITRPDKFSSACLTMKFDMARRH